MTINGNPNVQTDLDLGIIARVTGLTTLDGVAGWVLTEDAAGKRWAYAPMHHALLWGIIAQEV